MSRLHNLAPLLGCLGFVLVGVLVPDMPLVYRVLDAGLFGTGVLVFVLQMVAPPLLVLDEEGMSVDMRIRRPKRYAWQACGPFRATTLRFSLLARLQLVVFEDRAAPDRSTSRLRAFNRGLSGGSDSLIVGFGGLSAEDLARLLNRYHRAFG